MQGTSGKSLEQPQFHLENFEPGVGRRATCPWLTLTYMEEE